MFNISIVSNILFTSFLRDTIGMLKKTNTETVWNGRKEEIFCFNLTFIYDKIEIQKVTSFS